MKTLEELDCTVDIKLNKVTGTTDVYLKRIGDNKGYIKVFMYDLKEKGISVATEWANKNKKLLQFYREK